MRSSSIEHPSPRFDSSFDNDKRRFEFNDTGIVAVTVKREFCFLGKQGSAMRRWLVSILIVLSLLWISSGFAEDFTLQYFLAKSSSKQSELSKQEKTALLNQIGEAVEQAKQGNAAMIKAIQSGEIEILYHDGEFWMSKLEEDKESIRSGMDQMKILKEKATNLMASVILFKNLKDLASNLSSYNNMPSFSAFVGDLAPELELWTDPVFYRLYLLPLAKLRNVEPKIAEPKAAPSPEKKPVPPKK
jgi:hypothetical protein